jgi:hypothetical protein
LLYRHKLYAYEKGRRRGEGGNEKGRGRQARKEIRKQTKTN